MTPTPDKLPPREAADEFIENMGLSAEADGLPRIAGRMWGLFIIEDGPFSLCELAERLQVSRGSVSTNGRLLRALGILQRMSRPGDRQDYYRLAENPYDSLLLGYVERMRGTQRNVERAQAQLPDDWQGAHQRLENMRRFHESAVSATESLIANLRDQTDTSQDQQ